MSRSAGSHYSPALASLPHHPLIIIWHHLTCEDNEVGKKYSSVSRDSRSQCWQKREILSGSQAGDELGLDLETRANNVLASDTDSLIKIGDTMFSESEEIQMKSRNYFNKAIKKIFREFWIMQEEIERIWEIIWEYDECQQEILTRWGMSCVLSRLFMCIVRKCKFNLVLVSAAAAKPYSHHVNVNVIPLECLNFDGDSRDKNISIHIKEMTCYLEVLYRRHDVHGWRGDYPELKSRKCFISLLRKPLPSLQRPVPAVQPQQPWCQPGGSGEQQHGTQGIMQTSG